MLAADPVHDLERSLAGTAAGGARHEGDELLGLVRAGADVERLDREARVADPGVAVVPVALAADGLGQRGRGCGDDRAGRAVGEALEHARAEPDELPGAGPRRCRARPPRSARPRRCPRSGRGPRPRASARRAPAARPAAQRSAKPTRSPSATVKARVHRRPRRRRPARRPTTRRCDPTPNVRAPPSSSRISGRISPYSGRGGELQLSSTSPDTPSTPRSSSCGASKPSSWPRWPGANAIASSSLTVPVSVVNVVSITSVPGR